MSYTEIYTINENGDVEKLAEVRNAHRGAMAVWNYFEKTYLLPKQWPRMVTNEMQEIWDLWNNPKVPLSQRIAMQSTFDFALCYIKDAPQLVKAFREFPGNTSLSEQAQIIEDALNVPGIIGFCWNQTSVNGDMWYGEWIGENEYDEEYKPHNIFEGDDGSFWMSWEGSSKFKQEERS